MGQQNCYIHIFARHKSMRIDVHSYFMDSSNSLIAEGIYNASQLVFVTIPTDKAVVVLVAGGEMVADLNFFCDHLLKP